MGKKLSSREKVLLILLLVGVWIYGVYHFILSAQTRAYTRVQQELAEEKTKLTRARATAADLKTEMNLLKAAQEKMARAGELFNTEMRDGADLILLGLKSAEGNIDIRGVEPGGIVTNEHSLAIPLKIVVRGSYPDLLAFIYELEDRALANLAEIISLKIAAADTAKSSTASSSYSDGENDDVGVVEAEIGLVIYSAKTPESRLQLEQLAGWLRGRGNAFQPAGEVSPIPELIGHLKVPPPPAPSENDAGQEQEAGPPQTAPVDQEEVSKEP